MKQGGGGNSFCALDLSSGRLNTSISLDASLFSTTTAPSAVYRNTNTRPNVCMISGSKYGSLGCIRNDSGMILILGNYLGNTTWTSDSDYDEYTLYLTPTTLTNTNLHALLDKMVIKATGSFKAKFNLYYGVSTSSSDNGTDLGSATATIVDGSVSSWSLSRTYSSTKLYAKLSTDTTVAFPIYLDFDSIPADLIVDGV